MHLSLSSGYILPQIFREWMPIARNNYIHKSFDFHIGKLPMKLVYDDNNPISFINSCNRIGFAKDYRDIHKNDTFGTIVNKNGLLFWSYKSFSKSPPVSSSISNSNLNLFEITINQEFICLILAIIHDFVRDIPDNINKRIYKRNNKFLISYQNNKLLYIYPYSIFIKHSPNNHLVIYQNVYINPIETHKTKLFISTNNFIYKFFLFLFYTSLNSLPVNKFIYNLLLINDNISNFILSFFKNYMCIFEDSTIYHLIINRRYY